MKKRAGNGDNRCRPHWLALGASRAYWQQETAGASRDILTISDRARCGAVSESGQHSSGGDDTRHILASNHGLYRDREPHIGAAGASVAETTVGIRSAPIAGDALDHAFDHLQFRPEQTREIAGGGGNGMSCRRGALQEIFRLLDQDEPEGRASEK